MRAQGASVYSATPLATQYDSNAAELQAGVNQSFRTSLVVSLTAAFVACNYTLAAAQGLPDLSRLDHETRQSIELACITEKSNGPVAYGGCLRAQLQSIGVQPSDSTRVRSARSKHVDVKAPPISSGLSTGPPQAAPREQMRYLRYWQDPSVWALLIGVSVLLTPILWVLLSSRTRGGAKLGWFLVVMFFSWLGLAAFLIVTQAPRNRAKT